MYVVVCKNISEYGVVVCMLGKKSKLRQTIKKKRKRRHEDETANGQHPDSKQNRVVEKNSTEIYR